MIACAGSPLLLLAAALFIPSLGLMLLLVSGWLRRVARGARGSRQDTQEPAGSDSLPLETLTAFWIRRQYRRLDQATPKDSGTTLPFRLVSLLYFLVGIWVLLASLPIFAVVLTCVVVDPGSVTTWGFLASLLLGAAACAGLALWVSHGSRTDER